MYIDGALNLFRRLNPDVVSLLAAPALSAQRGSISSISKSHWYDANELTKPVAAIARRLRDELWRMK
jgi:hypothetical protein